MVAGWLKKSLFHFPLVILFSPTILSHPSCHHRIIRVITRTGCSHCFLRQSTSHLSVTILVFTPNKGQMIRLSILEKNKYPHSIINYLFLLPQKYYHRIFLLIVYLFPPKVVGDVKLDKDLGFECMQVLIKANSSDELDECIRVINKSYPILRDQLLVMEGNLEA